MWLKHFDLLKGTPYNRGTLVSFRIGVEAAEILAKEYAPVFSAYDLLNVEQYTAYTKLLIDNTAAKPFNMLTYPPMSGNKELAAAIKELSRLKRPKPTLISYRNATMWPKPKLKNTR